MFHANKKYMYTTNRYKLLMIFFILFIGCSKKTNQITVITKDGLLNDKVEIRNGLTSINRENDLDLFSRNLKTIFIGSDKENLETNFGENDFLIIYDDAYYYSFRHFIFTDFISSYPKGHDYKFEFFKQNDSIFMSVKIAGEHPMEFTRPLINKDHAEKYRCNTPVEKAGGIFNMIELKEKTKS